MSVRKPISRILAGLVVLALLTLSGCGDGSPSNNSPPAKSQPSEISKPKPPPIDPG